MALDPNAPGLIYQQFVNHGPAIQNALVGGATELFGILAIIEFVWVVGWSVALKSDIFDILIVVTKQIITLGFWYWILQNWAGMAKAITDTFGMWGNSAITAAGGTANMMPMGFLTAGLNLAHHIWQATSIGEPIISILLILAGFVDLIIFGGIASMITLVVVEAFLASYLGTVLIAFGASSWTRDYGVSQPRYALSVGVKRMTLQFIAGMGEIIVNDWIKLVEAQNGGIGWGDCGVMIVVPIILATLAYIAPKIAQDMIMGTHLSTSQGILATAKQMGSAAAAVGMGVAGAAAAGVAGTRLAMQQVSAAAAAGQGPAGAARQAATVARLAASNTARAAASDVGNRLAGNYSASHGYRGFRVAASLNNQRKENS